MKVVEIEIAESLSMIYIISLCYDHFVLSVLFFSIISLFVRICIYTLYRNIYQGQCILSENVAGSFGDRNDDCRRQIQPIVTSPKVTSLKCQIVESLIAETIDRRKLHGRISSMCISAILLSAKCIHTVFFTVYPQGSLFYSL